MCIVLLDQPVPDGVRIDGPADPRFHEGRLFADLEYQGKKRKTRRELFLQRMDGLIPWQRLEQRIRPVYAKPGKGLRPYPLPVMLRIHCVQLFYNLSDPGMEDLLYEAESVRRFVGLSLSEALPDETTILNFRHLLERHHWARACWRRSTPIWSRRDCGCEREPLWTPASSRLRPRPRIGLGSGTRRCIGRRRGISGISG